MTPSKILFYLCLSFIGGIFLNSIFNLSQVIWLTFLIFGILLISVFWPYKKLVIFGFCILFFTLGIWRYQMVQREISHSELNRLNDQEKIFTLIGIVEGEPEIGENSQRLKISNLKLETDKKWRKISGRVLVVTNRYPQYQYGDQLKITGKLKKPKNYLAKEKIYSIIYWPQIELLAKNQGNFIYGRILEFKNKLRESLYQNLSPSQSSILAAMILGDKRQLSNDLKEKLNLAGVRHITAVSGLHITILTSILITLLVGLGFWRQQAFYFALFFITLFIVMTGLQPSAIRAGIMGGLFLLAQYLGRLSHSLRSIVLAATLMLAQNPLLLKFDVGFQLSFLAMMGIIYWGPLFREWLKKIPEEKFFNLRSLISMTLSAQIFTFPILLSNFGYLSLIAPFTNILIVPLLPYVIALGFIFGLAGIISQPLGWFFSLPCHLLLTFITELIDFFSQLPFASLTLKISWIWLGLSYLILGFVTWQLKEKQRLKFLTY